MHSRPSIYNVPSASSNSSSESSPNPNHNTTNHHRQNNNSSPLYSNQTSQHNNNPNKRYQQPKYGTLSSHHQLPPPNPLISNNILRGLHSIPSSASSYHPNEYHQALIDHHQHQQQLNFAAAAAAAVVASSSSSPSPSSTPTITNLSNLYPRPTIHHPFPSLPHSSTPTSTTGTNKNNNQNPSDNSTTGLNHRGSPFHPSPASSPAYWGLPQNGTFVPRDFERFAQEITLGRCFKREITENEPSSTTTTVPVSKPPFINKTIINNHENATKTPLTSNIDDIHHHHQYPKNLDPNYSSNNSLSHHPHSISPPPSTNTLKVVSSSANNNNNNNNNNSSSSRRKSLLPIGGGGSGNSSNSSSSIVGDSSSQNLVNHILSAKFDSQPKCLQSNHNTYDHKNLPQSSTTTTTTTSSTHSASVISGPYSSNYSISSVPLSVNSMPSPMTISSSSTSAASSLSSSSAPSNIINHHHHSHHHLQHHHPQPPPPPPPNPLIHQTTGLSTTSSTLLHHHHTVGGGVGSSTSTTNAAPPPPSLHFPPPPPPHHHHLHQQQQHVHHHQTQPTPQQHHAVSHHHHHHQQQQQHGSTLTSLQHNHHHGHLLNEIYGKSNKKSRLTIPNIIGDSANSAVAAFQLQNLHQIPPGHLIPTSGHQANISFLNNLPNNVIAATISGGAGAGNARLYHHAMINQPPPSSIINTTAVAASNQLLANIHQLSAANKIIVDQSVAGTSLPSSLATNNNSIITTTVSSSSSLPPPSRQSLSSATNNTDIANSAPINQELLIETIDDNVEDGYNPHFENISPTPNDESRVSPLTSLKDQILSQIHSCDRQIQTVEAHINVLRSKAQQLEAATRKPPTDPEEEVQNNGTREPTLVQKIYLENTAKANRAHQQFNKLLNFETLNPLPLYNHPIDLKIMHEIHDRYLQIRSLMIERIRKLKKHKKQIDRYQSAKYDQQMLVWLKRVEATESNPTKKARDLKIREYFEKQFPELKKQREDRERLQRGTQRIRSEAEFEEIIDGLQVQELEDTKMRSYMVIPPILYNREERKRNVRFDNRNGFLNDPMALHKEIKNVNIWTEGEKEIFRDKYLMNPKKFGTIAHFLERKSIADCIQYYYLSKKHENYKQLLRKHVKKRTRAMIRAQQQQQQNMANNANNHTQLQNAQQQNRSSPLIASSTASSATITSTTSTTSRITVDNGGTITTVGVKQYPQSATSVILPYSLPLTSSSTTITFTISSKFNNNNNGGTENSDSKKSTQQQISINGPITTTSATTITTTAIGASAVPSSSNNILSTNLSTAIKCDNSGDNTNNNDINPNALATNPATNGTTINSGNNNNNHNTTTCDNVGTVGDGASGGLIMLDSVSINCCCLLCGSKIPTNNPNKSRSVNLANIHVYGLQKFLKSNALSGINGKRDYFGRVCLSCHLKKSGNSGGNNTATSSSRQCPIPTCPSRSQSPKRKLKRLKQLPQQWIEMSDTSDLKQRLAEEFNIPLDLKIGCARCVMRIGRRMGIVGNSKSNHDQSANNSTSNNSNHHSINQNFVQTDPAIAKENVRKLWSDSNDVDRLRSMIKSHGKNWLQISTGGGFVENKTPKDCYKAYVYFKNEFQLINSLKEYYQSIGRPLDFSDTDGDDALSSVCGGDLSGDDTTGSSLDGALNNESDTASASSSVGGKPDQDVINTNEQPAKSNLQDFKPLSLSQGSLKSDYDSSATMSADESSNANEGGIDRSGSFSFQSRAAAAVAANNRIADLKTDPDLLNLKRSSLTPPATSVAAASNSTITYSYRDKQLGFDAPQVPTFLINPNAPSVQITNQSLHHPPPPPLMPSSHIDHHRPVTVSSSSSATITTVSTSNANSITTTATQPPTNEVTPTVAAGGTCVRDLIYKAIEKSLQTQTKTPANADVKVEPEKPPPPPPSLHQPLPPTSTASVVNPNFSHPLCLKRDETSPSSSMNNPQSQAPDLSKIDLLASAAMQQQRSSSSIKAEISRPEGLAMNFSYGHSTPSMAEQDEVQDLSNKPKDRNKTSYDQMNRNSPKDGHPNNKIMKLDSASRLSPLQTKSPFSYHPQAPMPPQPPQSQMLMDQRFANIYGSIQPAHSINNPASRIPNMIDALMHDPKVTRPPPQPSPYAILQQQQQQQQQPLKINSKSPSQLSTTFPISPKAETAIRDKLIQPVGGSITQGTPVVLQAGQQQQQPPPPSHTPSPQQQHVALATLNAAAAAAAANSKFPSAPHPAATFHPGAMSMDMLRQLGNEFSKGSITQGTPLIMSSQPGNVTLPLIATSSSVSSLHHPQLINTSRNMKTDLDFGSNNSQKQSSRSNKYADSKSIAANSISASISPYDFIERMNKTSGSYEAALQQQQHPIYRPFSPTYPKSLPPGSMHNSGKDSHQSQIYIDFNTSKQMQPRRSSATNEKELPSQHPESMATRLIPPSGLPPGLSDKLRVPPFQISPAPSPSSIYLPDRSGIGGEKIIDPQTLLQWNQLTMGPMGTQSFLNRQNVIQPCFPPVSKGTSVIQSGPLQQQAANSRELSQMGQFPPEHDPLSTLVNAAVQLPKLSEPNASSASTSSSIQSRLTKEGFEKCFSETMPNSSSNQSTKQAISNRIIYPPIGMPNDSGHLSQNDLIGADLSKSSSRDDKNSRNRDSRPPSSSGPDNLDLMSKIQANQRLPPDPSNFFHSLSEHEKLIFLENQQKQQKKYPNAPLYATDLQLLQYQTALDQQRGSQAAYRQHQEQLLAAAAFSQNHSLKMSRSDPFSPEHFEKQFADPSNLNRETREIFKLQEARKLASGNEIPEHAASRLFSQSFQKDPQPNSTIGTGSITAANLIDAIITKQINTNSTKGIPSSLGSYPQPSLNRIKQQMGNIYPSPSTTPTPASTSNGKLLMEQDRVIDFGLVGKGSTQQQPESNTTSNKPSLRDAISKMITDNIHNSSSPPCSSPSSMVSSSQNLSRIKTHAQLEGIAAAAANSGSLTSTTNSSSTSAENFKLRRALQPPNNDKSEHDFSSKRPMLDVPHSLDPASRQHVIHMVSSSGSSNVTSIGSTVSSPSLSGPNIKHLSHRIEPISPPQGGTSSKIPSGMPQQPPIPPPPTHWPNMWSYMPFYGAPGKQPSNGPPPTSETHHVQHLASHHDSFFMSSRIAEAMQRVTPNTVTTTNENADNKSKSDVRSETPSKKIQDEDKSAGNRNTPNNSESQQGNTLSDSNKVTYPDSPCSPGEMVIDENRPPSTPSPGALKNPSNTDQASDCNKNKNGSVIKLHNNETTESNATISSSSSNPTSATTNLQSNATSNNDSQPQYEPLSDDES